MRIARPCFFVTNLTAFAGYFLNCLVVCHSVFFLLFSPLDVNVLITYCTSVGGLHNAYDLICISEEAFQNIHFSHLLYKFWHHLRIS